MVCLCFLGDAEAGEVEPASAVIRKFIPLSLHREGGMINHIFLFLLHNLGLLSQVELVLVDDQNFLVFFMQNLNSTFADVYFLFAGEEGLVECDVIGGYL